MSTLTKQQKYSMDLKEIAKKIKQQLKRKYPKCKFSVTIERYSMGQSLHISLMSGPFEAVDKSKTVQKMIENGNGPWVEKVGVENAVGHFQLNPYTLKDYDEYEGLCNGCYLTPKAFEVMKFALNCSQHFNYDDSDIQTDYFDVNFYLHLNIGKWDKHYQIV